MWQLSFEQVVMTIPDDLSTGVAMSTLLGTSDGWFIYPCLKVRIRSPGRISSCHFDPRESLLIKGQSIPAFHACGRFQSAHAPSEIRRVDRDHCF